jgi:HSP20 family molecular chaperone IbpA
MDLDEFDKIWKALIEGKAPNFSEKSKYSPSPIDSQEWDRQSKSSDYELIQTENNARYLLDLGGMQKEEIIIQMEGTSLMISGDSETKSFLFDIDIEKDFINPKAKFNNGILEITFDKTQLDVVEIPIE